jgi:uncharacterized protein YqfB (UPF0267 family)
LLPDGREHGVAGMSAAHTDPHKPHRQWAPHSALRDQVDKFRTENRFRLLMTTLLKTDGMSFQHPRSGRMIFQRTWKLVHQGRKTQTRRIVKNDKPPCRVDRPLAVQPGRGKKRVCDVDVIDVRKVRLGDLSKKDAQAEGYENRQAFIKVWKEMHGDFNPEQPVWVIEFLPPTKKRFRR